MIGNGVEMSSIFYRILGPLVLGWAPNYFVLGAQLATSRKRLVCIPGVYIQAVKDLARLSFCKFDQAGLNLYYLSM